jgi:hypothetical protein
MSLDKRTAVLRVLDDQNRLSERADNKSISLLSALGFFTAFFIAYNKDIEPDPVTIILVVVYFITAILAILNIIMAVNPRIRIMGMGGGKNKPDPSRAAFFAEICKFSSLPEYRESLKEMLKDEDTVIEVYTRQIYEVSQITAAKYKHTTRAVYFVIAALTSEFALIAYLFISNALTG